MASATAGTQSYMDALDPVIREVIAPNAIEVDRDGVFPRAAIEALGKVGLLGLVSSPEVGGLGAGHRAATLVVEAIAKHCASTAMVVCMHYAATAVIEAFGSTRGARGRGIWTCAYHPCLLRGRIAQPLLGADEHGETRRGTRCAWTRARAG